jgi:hypothetical protein
VTVTLSGERRGRGLPRAYTDVDDLEHLMQGGLEFHILLPDRFDQPAHRPVLSKLLLVIDQDLLEGHLK